MALYIKQGDLLTADVDYICHQVNCQGKMNSGIAKSIREKWPIVYEKYFEKCDALKNMRPLLLGDTQFVELWEDNTNPVHKLVINMFSQEHYGYNDSRYTSYDAFWNCLNTIKQEVRKGSKIGFPGNIGCCRGGANWNVILEMIREVLAEDFEVYIYFLED